MESSEYTGLKFTEEMKAGKVARTAAMIADGTWDQDYDVAEALTLAKSTQALAGHVQKTLIVAGRANLDAADAAAPSGTLVVGLGWDAAWHDEDGVGLPALDLLVRKTERDTDVVVWMNDTGNRVEAWDEAKALGEHLKRIGARSVKYVNDTVPLWRQLNTRTDDTEDRRAYLTGIVTGARALAKRPTVVRVAKTREVAVRESNGGSAIAPTVDMDRGVIWIPTGEGQQTVIAEFAATMLTTYKVTDDLKDPAGKKATFTHDLEVVTVRDGRRQEQIVREVSDADLQNPRGWLNQIDGGTQVVTATGNNVAEAIGNAIRANEPAGVVPVINVFTRTGWHEMPDGEIGFLSNSGLLTAEGLSDRAKSSLSQSLGTIALRDTRGLSRTKEIEAARNTRAMYKELTDPNLFIALWGVAAHAVAGLGVGAVGCVFGKAGSGKSTMAQGITGHAAAAYNPNGRGMFVFDSTTANVAKAGVGLHEFFLVVDDARKRTTQKRADDMADALEITIRRAYAGGHAGYSGNEYNAVTRKWEAGIPDLSDPAIMIVGEAMPDAPGNDLDSSKERLYPATIPIGFNIFASGNARRYVELATTDLPQIHLAAFVSWIAGQMRDGEDGRAGWTARWEDARRTAEDARLDLKVSTRVRAVSVVPQIGMHVWLDYLLAIGAITDAEHASDLAEVAQTTRATAYTHGTENVSTSGAEWEGILNSLRSSVASGQAFVKRAQRGSGPILEDLELMRRQKMLGAEKLGRGGTPDYIAMQPRDVLSILSTEAKYRGLTEKDLMSKFAPVAMVDAGKKYKSAIIAGLKVQTLAIDWELFSNNDENESNIEAGEAA